MKTTGDTERQRFKVLYNVREIMNRFRERNSVICIFSVRKVLSRAKSVGVQFCNNCQKNHPNFISALKNNKKLRNLQEISNLFKQFC